METPTNTGDNKRNEKPSIVINLQNSSNSKAFKESQQIHYYEFKKAVCWIDKNIERLQPLHEEYAFGGGEKPAVERQLNTISILGSRGSGKTSFLLSLLEKYRTNEDIQVLEILDPTLIEEKGHIFLSVISQITDLVNKKLDTGNCHPECAGHTTQEIWRQKLRKLSSGLPSVDGVSRPDESSWQDPDYIMDKGLRAIHAARNLEHNFRKLVDMALRILGKKAFLLPFDDIDVDFKKGWPVLETLRKYLVTPRIITLISGDIDLYSKAIRKQQWKNFGKPLLINEAENLHKIEEYNDLVTEMEGQYLQKVLKPEYRIHLNTLLEKINMLGLDIRVEYPDEDKRDSTMISRSIREDYKAKLRCFGISNISQSEAFITYLLSLPLRTQIQFLSQFGNVREDYPVEVTDPFLSDLYEKQVNVDLAKNMPKMLTVVILKLLLEQKVLSEAYQLQPTLADQSLNSSVTALSLLFAQRLKSNPYLIFDYFIKIGYLRNLCSMIGYEEEKEKKNKEIVSSLIPSIEALCKHAQIFQDKVLRDVTGNITAYFRGFLDYDTKKEENISSRAGTIVLRGLYSLNKKDPTGRIDAVFEQETGIKRCIAYMPLSISSYTMKNRSLLTYSLYALLATISDLIKEKDNLGESLLNFSQIRSYIVPDFKKNDFENNAERNVIEEANTRDPEDAYQDLSPLEKQLKKWISLFPGIEIPPYLLGKIATRLFYALDNLEKGVPPTHLGDEMARRIVAFLNAVLVEDVKENYQGSKDERNRITLGNLNLNNTQTSYSILEHNLSVSLYFKGDFRFSNWMLSCPLLLAFLPPRIISSILERVGNNSLNDIGDCNIYDLLTQVHSREAEEKGGYKQWTNQIFSSIQDRFIDSDSHIQIKTFNSDKPIFSGAKRNVLKTVEVLKDYDPGSYSFIWTHSFKDELQLIRDKYGHLFENPIQWDSVTSLIKNMDKSDPTIQEWVNYKAPDTETDPY